MLLVMGLFFEEVLAIWYAQFVNSRHAVHSIVPFLCVCVCVLYANESSKNNIYLKLFLVENVSNLSNCPYFLKFLFVCFFPFPPLFL